MPAPSKRDKQNAKRFERNHRIKSRLRNLSKRFYKAMGSGDTDHAKVLRDRSQQEYDKAAGKGIIHPNKASRKISRLDKALAGEKTE